MRRKIAERRAVQKDWMYGSELVTSFINKIMIDGKKQTAEKLFYDALKQASNETSHALGEIELLELAIKNSTPEKKIVHRRYGSTTYGIPKEMTITEKNQKAISILVSSARAEAKKEGRNFTSILTAILIKAANNTGKAVELKEEQNRLAKEGAAFSHLA